jgi:hypothetical protein
MNKSYETTTGKQFIVCPSYKVAQNNICKTVQHWIAVIDGKKVVEGFGSKKQAIKQTSEMN